MSRTFIHDLVDNLDLTILTFSFIDIIKNIVCTALKEDFNC